MERYLVKTVKQPLQIRQEVPGSKSITNRALLMAAMGRGESELDGVLFSDDSDCFLKALQDLGFTVRIDREKKRVRITGESGRIPRNEAEVYVGSAGTAARFLTAFLAMSDGKYRLDSSAQMKKRPMRELLEALEQLGAKIAYEQEPYHFPMVIQGIGAGEKAAVSVNIDRSSQFLSALLMTAPLCWKELTITLTGKRNARSYVAMTEQMMRQFGHPGVQKINRDCYRVTGFVYQAQSYRIEPDVSAACYFYAMAAVTGGSALVPHVRRDSLQGDMRFVNVLQQMGCAAEWESVQGLTGEQLVVTGPAHGELKGITASFSDFSDQALTMAAIAPYADGVVRMEGIGHIRGQESDRIAVMARELARMGIRCEEMEQGIVIYPGKLHGAEIMTYNDHRVAMSFAVTGLRTEGIVIADPDCCRKTFPDYFSVLDQICTAQKAD
ncbi:MAG: 3-phosphoshikimate 1-carboxyvinyltransferase [Clostridiaceae bacterium]|nr:3-phosphoshikimate 1-carboxyvinyltransferase [Clostridiaceae bacterium]